MKEEWRFYRKSSRDPRRKPGSRASESRRYAVALRPPVFGRGSHGICPQPIAPDGPLRLWPDQIFLSRPLGIVVRDRFKRSEEHTSELQSLMRISYAVFCLQ